MVERIFKTTFRSLWKNKGFSSLNTFGLAIGIACAGLIFLWVEDEMDFDGHNVKKDHLYFVRVNAVAAAGIWTHWSTPGIMAPVMQEEIPGIANTCRTSEGDTRLLFTIGDKSVYASGKYAEPSIFNMFTLPFVQGSAKTAFSQLYSLVITEKAAKKFYGSDENIIGKTIRVDNKQDYVITGVVKDNPQNSSLQFEWLAPFQIWYQQSPWAYKWENNCVSTYAELKPGASVEDINRHLYNFVQKRAPTSSGHVFLFGMNDWHLRNEFDNGKPTGGGQIEYVRLFTIIAWIILLIACINFMNLATARSEKRAKEVGVRKVLGAAKPALIGQFIGEAMLMAFTAAVLALIIMVFVLPAFNTLVQKNLTVDITSSRHVIALLLIAMICGLVAGSYPSLYLSSFNPVFILKRIKLKTGSAAVIRKGLVVLQFSVSIVLIIATVIIYQQIQHIKSRSLGFNKNNLVQIYLQGDIQKHFEVIRQDLLNSGAVENVSLTDHEIIYGGNNTDDISWHGKNGGKIVISTRVVDPDFFEAAGMRILEGRNFELADTINFDKLASRPNVVITQSLAKLMGSESALGKSLFGENDTSLNATVVGVVNDYVYGDMYGKSDPVIFFNSAPRFKTTMYIRIKEQSDVETAMAKIGAIIKKDNPAYPFESQFVDDQFNQMFLNEQLVSKLSGVFATLAIIISCLGLFGLAAYTAERRTKEIGVRKVLGASIAGITTLLSQDFLKLIAFSCLVSFPVAWLMMHAWLQNYKYRIEISWWVFIAAGISAILIALTTISFQSIKAAIANPVKSLRTE